MRFPSVIAVAAVLAALAQSPLGSTRASAASVLIRGGTIHTIGADGVVAGDLLITDGRIAAIGSNLAAPPGAEIIDAAGRVVTPGLFGGVGHLGVEEIGIEPTEGDYALALGEMRPEFDVTLAFNPNSAAIAVNRVGGVTFAVLAPTAEAGSGDQPGGTIIAGQGAVVTLDGNVSPAGRALFVNLGGDANGLSGGSRAAQYMLLRQALLEVAIARSAAGERRAAADSARPADAARVHRARLAVRVRRRPRLGYPPGRRVRA